jgi:CxxC motif-containing protein (DUF1111 family)
MPLLTTPRLLILAVATIITVATACSGTSRSVQAISVAIPEHEPGEERSGGATTVNDATVDAFARSAPGLSREQRRAFNVGNSFFNDNWVVAPASAEGRDGLGPLFNATNCSGCHFRDGRGRPPANLGDPLESMLVRISVADGAGGDQPHPVYGGQWQDKTIPGVPPEGGVRITYTEIPDTYADGTPYALRRPHVELTHPNYGPLGDGLRLSARVAPVVFGLGLLEAIPEEQILAHADPDDRNGDGIRGRPQRVQNLRTGTLSLGRFGWKAGQPTVEQQSAGAFDGDIGITSSLFPRDHATASQTAARAAPTGGEPELSDHKLDRITLYCRTLAVPSRRQTEAPQVRHGKALFSAIGCATCHVPSFTTGVVPDLPSLSQQRIHPYTDLLLHDLGDGLADQRPEGLAGPRDWRTPPLWGLGLLQTVNNHELLLHDGRARTAAEAILWHGGEAAASAEAFRRMPADERAALLAFLHSL